MINHPIIWDPPLSLFAFGEWDGLRYYTFMRLVGLALAYWIVKYLYADQKIDPKAFEPLLFSPCVPLFNFNAI